MRAAHTAGPRWRAGLMALGVLTAACGDGGVIFLDARDASAGLRDGATDVSVDGAPPDAPDLDGGRDAGAGDGGVEGGCAPPTPAPFMPVDTGGAAGESVGACIARVGASTDDRVPMDQGYVLTTFGGGADTQPVACAGAADADGSWYYLADAQRMPCGLHVRLVDPSRTRCVIAEVADVGPNACVEEAAGRPVVDASPLVAEALFDVASAGYSERRELLAAPVGGATPLGRCSLAPEADRLAGFVGGACDVDADCAFAGGRCLSASEGWPGGHCTKDCSSSCPDRVGSFAYTGCATERSETICLARCDFTLFDSGCRPGYGCFTRPAPSGGADRDVCLPLSCR